MALQPCLALLFDRFTLFLVFSFCRSSLSAPSSAREPFQVNFSVANLKDGGTGDFTVKVYPDWAPIGAERFHELVKEHFFDDTRLFRVVPGFIAQFGISGNPEIAARWRYERIADDHVRKANTRGRLSFAHAGKFTRTTQIFINLKNNSFLNIQRFAPFGEVIAGMDVVDRFYAGYGDTPSQDKIHSGGNDYLDAEFPKLSYFTRVFFTEDAGKMPWVTGWPASIVLLATTFFGFLAVSLFLRFFFEKEETESPPGQVLRHTLVVALVAAVFWVWALINCIQEHVDLGVVSFILVLAASAHASRISLYEILSQRLSCSSSVHLLALTRCHLCFMSGACILVAANYVLGCVIVLGQSPLSTFIYFVFGVVWWVCAGMVGFMLGRRWLADIKVEVSCPVELEDVEIVGKEENQQ